MASIENNRGDRRRAPAAQQPRPAARPRPYSNILGSSRSRTASGARSGSYASPGSGRMSSGRSGARPSSGPARSGASGSSARGGSRPGASGARRIASSSARQPVRRHPAARRREGLGDRVLALLAEPKRLLLPALIVLAAILVIALISSLSRSRRNSFYMPIVESPAPTEIAAVTEAPTSAPQSDASAQAQLETQTTAAANTASFLDDLTDDGAEGDDSLLSDGEEGEEIDPGEEEDSEAETAALVPVPEAVDYQILEGIPNTDRALGIPESEMADDSYFDDAVFIGDSVSLKLNYFVRDQRKEDYPNLLGKAQFLTAGSLGSATALRPVSSDSKHPTYQGEKMLLEDAIRKMGAKKVYIMFGLNDIALYGPQESADNMIELCKRIKQKNPDVKIFIESATPTVAGKSKKNKLNNNTLLQYDLILYEYCKQYAAYDLYFVDVAYAIRDEKGCLPTAWCSDAEKVGVHMRSPACKVWLKYLYTHTLR